MTKSALPENNHWQSDRRDTKLHNILGVTEADLQEARNQSISSVATTKVQNNSLSDATTEAERSPPGQHKISHEPWKGSSIPTQAKSDHGHVTVVTTPLIHIRNYDSSSTLHSHYNVHNSSLSRSRRPSESSEPKFPLHKTKSTPAQSTTSAPDSFWQFRLFKSATPRSAKDTKTLTRARAPTSRTLPPEPATPTDWRSVVGHLTPKRPKSVKSMIHAPKSKEGIRFNLATPVPTPTAVLKTAKYNDVYPMDPTCVKVNIWKPKAGAKHWFDGLEGDSSEDENFDEPEFQQNFVLGIESDFHNDQIKAHSSSRQTQYPTKTECDRTPKDDANPTSRKTPTRVAVLNAKASRSNLSSTQSTKSQSNPLRHHDLSESSVLDLSSDEEEMPTAKKTELASSGHGLRDSVCMDFNIDSSDELSTARTINVRSRMRPIEVVRIRRPTANPLPAQDQSHMSIPKRGSSLPLANRYDHHESKNESSDLIAAFPPTPVESVTPSLNTSIRSSTAFPPTPVESVAPSFNTSIRSSTALSSTGSMESRRLMSVTRQEESLLAAMRLKKAAMQYNVSQTERSKATPEFSTYFTHFEGVTMGAEGMGGRPRESLFSLRNLCLGMLTIQFSVFILLLHYSRVMLPPDGHRYLPSTAVFLVELLKLSVCLTISFYELSVSVSSSTTLAALVSAFGNAIFAGDSWKMAIPACLYTLANSLQYVGISNLDAATFHVVYQFKIFVTALLSVVMLKRSLTGRQWFSLLLLMAGVAIVSMPHEEGSLASSHHTRIYLPRSSYPIRDHFHMSGTHLNKRSATYEGIEEDEWGLQYNDAAADASVGLMAVISVCILSGLAGVYFEKVIKESPNATSLWIRNVQLSLYSLFPALFIGVVFLDGEFVAKYGFFAGYNWVVTLSIVVQTVGGVIAAFCIFFADNISKNFAVSISMVLSSLASFVFFDFTLTTNFLCGTTIVLLATFVYSAHDGERPRSSPVQLREQEKELDASLIEDRDVSIKIPKTPLILKQTALATSRPGSPTRKKRKSDMGDFRATHD
ncbi:hypothetical protein DV736_g3329, partial [Chaetothyriales sp. CBS 134916]